MDEANEVTGLKARRLETGGDKDEVPPPQHECAVLCECLHSSAHEQENSPMMSAVLCAPVSKVYRFQTDDRRWLLVTEQMSETPLSFSVPRQLLSTLIEEHADRVQEMEEFGELLPHWDGLRHDIVNHCNHLIGCYQETIAELDQLSAPPCFKSSSSRSDRHLQFVPTNLHAQRMAVSCQDSTGVWYEVITFGAPANHHQAFKHGGLQRLLDKHASHSPVWFSQDECHRARDLLASVSQLQPLVFGLAEELLSVSLDEDTEQLQRVLDVLMQQTELFVHAIKDELVKSALLAIHHDSSSFTSNSIHVHSNGLVCHSSPASQLGLLPPAMEDAEYDEEKWDMAWANVAKSLHCIIAMVERIKGREECPQELLEASGVTTSSWQEQLLPLVVTLRDCVREAMGKSRAAMTFVVLQGAMAATVAQGSTELVQRRHAVFSQALSAVVCGFLLKLYGCLKDLDFLHQLHAVGVLIQFEGLLSTYGDEEGMLEDMAVGVADLSDVTFIITEATRGQPNDLLPALRGTWGGLVVEVPLPSETFKLLPWELRNGHVIRVHPVLFNIGINQQQSLAERFGDRSLQERLTQQSCERLKGYCDALRRWRPETAACQSLWDTLVSLERRVDAKKRKNVEVLWLAASVCRQVNGVRLTSCKSAKDRTAMSVTLEQCVLLRDQHTLSQEHFATALDSMRRSRLSWGQMLGCYAHSGFTVSGLDPGEKSRGLQRSWLLPSLAAFAARRHVYPMAILLVTSHLLVLWLILSLVILLVRNSEGCRMENVQKNIGHRRFAFSSVQLLTFPKLYRPPEGSYG